MAETIDAWVPFATAVMGASAVLVGLIFVALSINLDALLPQPLLLRRAGAAIALLLSVLLATVILLVPGQSARVVGIEMVAVAAAGTLVIGDLLARRLSELDEPYRRHYRGALWWAWGVQLGYAICGVSLIVGAGGGLYWLVPACILGLCRAILESWVLLVEIKR
jgi:modulator of FtsH protease